MAHLQILKKALISYVTNSAKAVWSAIAYPLSIFSSRSGKLKGYRIYGNTIQGSDLFDKNTVKLNYYLDDNGNELASSSSYFLSDYVSVISGASYSVRVTASPSVASTVRISYFDTDKTFVGQSKTSVTASKTYETTILIEEGISYIRISSHQESIVEILPAPSPDNSIEMQCVGELVTEGEDNGKYKVTAVARGKNILKNPLDISSWKKGAVPGFSGYAYIIGDILPENRTMTLSFDYNTLPTYFYFVTDDDAIPGTVNQSTGTKTVYLTTTGAVNKKFTFTPKTGKMYALVNAASSNNATSATAQAWLDKFEYIQIEYGGEATEYEPYIEPQTFDIYLNEPLRKVPDAEDYIDFEKGVVVRSLKERALTGNENWYREAFRVYCFAEKSSSDGNKMLCISNRFVPYSWEKLYQNSFLATKNVGIAQQSGGVIVITPSQDIPSVEDWKAQLKAWNDEENPLTVIYYVNPTEEEVELPKLPQYKGTTVYEVDTTVKPSGIEVCYYE